MTDTVEVGISEKARQTLREMADQTGQSMQRILDQAIEDYRRKLFLDAVNAGYAALRADPQAWAEVEAERQSMAGSLMDGLDADERWGEDGDLLPPGERDRNG
jgi:hypothetical protein